MPRVIIKGAIGPVAQPVEIDHDPVRGTVITQRFISAGDNCVGIAQVAAAGGHAYKLKRSSHISTCDVTWSGGTGSFQDVAQANWQVMGNEIQESIWLSPPGLAAQAAYPVGSENDVVRDVRLGLSALEAGKDDFEIDFRDSLPAGELEHYDRMLGYFLRGQETFPFSQPVVKLTYSVSNYFTGTVGGQPESLWSTGAILALGPPTVQTQQINAAGVDGSSSADGFYVLSWRLVSCTAITGAQNRSEVSMEWWAGQWDTRIYGAVS